jgi:hypothetical protein
MSQREIRINHPGDGDWVMGRIEGVFNEKTDHVVAMHRDGKTVGGVVFTGYLGSSLMMHSAGSKDNWVTRDFLWMIFHYAFAQLNCRKAMGLVKSTNHVALRVNKHLGWTVAAVIDDVYPDGSDLVIMEMTRDQCRYLNLRPRHYRSNLLPENVS